MPFAPSQVVEYRVFCSLNEQTSINVRHLRVDTVSGTGATPQQLADALSNGIGTVLKPLLSSGATFRGAGVRVIWPLPVTVETLSNAGNGLGAAGGTAQARQTCGLISLRTPLAGRANRGRFYVPFPGGNDNAIGAIPSTTYQTNLAVLMGYLVATVTAGTVPNTNNFVPIIWHRQAKFSTDITSGTINNKWATQRRRGSYGRPNSSPI